MLCQCVYDVRLHGDSQCPVAEQCSDKGAPASTLYCTVQGHDLRGATKRARVVFAGKKQYLDSPMSWKIMPLFQYAIGYK